MNIINKMEELISFLNDNTKLYNLGTPKISDLEWDNKYFELEQLEKETGIILNNSPTHNITFEVVDKLNKVTHNHKMLSLPKTKDLEEIKKFFKDDKECIVMCKMDGLTCSLIYEDGVLISAETRGNGIIGEDILHNVRVMENVPKQIPVEGKLVIDGEIICDYLNFKRVSDIYKNPRNFAAGSIRLLDSRESQSRNLTFVVWEIIEGLERYNTLKEKLNALSSFGFTVVPFLVTTKDNINNETITSIKDEALKYYYPMDGVVFKYNDIQYGRSLGETAHHFNNAIAFKFYDDIYETTLINIEYTMGRTGVLTPVAIFEPIDLDGSMVERASLHNLSILEELLGQPYVGQKIWVSKRNMIIPQVEKAEKDGAGEKILIPEVCPVCGKNTSIKMENNSKMLVCTNPACEGKLINIIDHYAGKKGMDIKGLSKMTLEKLIDWNWIGEPSCLYDLKTFRNEWIKKPGFGPRSVDNILHAIESSKKCDLNKFISALGIPLIGETGAKALADKFKTWEEFIKAVENNYKFYNLPNFGIEMHNAILNFDYREAKFIAETYLNFKSNDNDLVSNSEQILKGQTIVITGKLSHFKNREELKKYIESFGGKVVDSISKNTNYLINNDIKSTSSKNNMAKKLNIPILTEKDFLKKFDF